MLVRVFHLLLIALFACLSLGLPGDLRAAPEAHILRIDPRAAQQNGSPILTSVIEVVENKRVSDILLPCASLTGSAQLACMGDQIDRTQLYTAFPFPGANALLTVKTDTGDVLAKLESQARWGESQQQPGVGTAWLLIIDADARMGSSFEDAKEVANRFIAGMGPNDIVNITFVNDRMVAGDSKWLGASQKAKATAFLQSVTGTFKSQGRNRSLFTIIKGAATDAWKSLGNSTEKEITIPLHQAMVVLSSGYGGADAMTTGPGALSLQQYMTGGRFPENNTALPKAPVPIISVYFPPKGIVEEYRISASEFMQNLANPEIGGYFTVMQEGQRARAATIVNAVRTRFSKMYIVKWRVACVNRSVTQSFELVFQNVTPPIAGDSTFKDVPVGIDPTTWPIDVDMRRTQDSAKADGGVYPKGRFKVYGTFCWGGNHQRAEVYFLPAGQQLPAALGGADLAKAQEAQQQLIEMGMRGTAISATDTFVEFEAPDKDKILHGSGDQAVVRLVIYDNQAKRTSGVTSDSVIQLKGTTTPFPLIPVLGGALGLVVIALLLLLLLRGGNRRAAAPPPAPVVASGAIVRPFMTPGGMPAPAAAPGMPAPAAGPGMPAPAAGPGMPAPAAPGMPAPAVGGVNPEFLYGAAAAPVPQQGFGYGPALVNRAILQGASGVFTVVPGTELHVGRDGSRCEILLSEPRVSGVHASLRIEQGQLLVRDESSNNGTYVNGGRIDPGVWVAVVNGSLLRFGPIELSVRTE